VPLRGCYKRHDDNARLENTLRNFRDVACESIRVGTIHLKHVDALNYPNQIEEE